MTPKDLKLANALADAAGSVIRPMFRGEWSEERKSDRSPVTEADRAAEAAMRALIEEHFPDDGIIGEEYGTSNEGAGRQWVLDPIDGTTSFIAGRPIFGTLIALVQDGWPVLGVIDQPIARERWVGRIGEGTTFNGKPAHVRTCKEFADAVLG
ncbi:MAG: inositol monophosphatase family protein, partial [Erythrobacter sp.]